MLNAGDIVGKYKIVRSLGSGGMADVYEAEDPSLGRRVALKVLPPELTRNKQLIQRFEKEVRAAASLNHHGIVTVFEVGEHDGLHYYSMRLLTGGDLRDRIDAGLSEIEALATLREIADAFSHAHQRGFVHRDVKPENIIFDEQGYPVLTDFGIAKAVDSGTRVTATGVSVGTPRYISPEQARGQPVDARADIYSMGVILYEMLVGKPPYDGEESLAVIFQHVTEPIPRLPEEKARFQPLIDTLMAKKPDERPESADALVKLIDQYLPTQNTQEFRSGAGATQSNPLVARLRTPSSLRTSGASQPAAEPPAEPEPPAETAAEREQREAEAARRAEAEQEREAAERRKREEQERQEAERREAEEKARQEAERQEAERRKREEAEKRKADEQRRKEAERQEAERRKREEEEKRKAEEQRRQEAERQEAERQKREEEEKRKAEEARRRKEEAERKRREDEARKAAEEKRRKEEAEAKAARKREAEEKARQQREEKARQRQEEQARKRAETARQQEERRQRKAARATAGPEGSAAPGRPLIIGGAAAAILIAGALWFLMRPGDDAPLPPAEPAPVETPAVDTPATATDEPAAPEAAAPDAPDTDTMPAVPQRAPRLDGTVTTEVPAVDVPPAGPTPEEREVERRAEQERRDAEAAAQAEREQREAEAAARREREQREAEEAARREREQREAEEAREAEARRAQEEAAEPEQAEEESSLMQELQRQRELERQQREQAEAERRAAREEAEQRAREQAESAPAAEPDQEEDARERLRRIPGF